MTYLEAARETRKYINESRRYDPALYDIKDYDEYVVCARCPSEYGLIGSDEENDLCESYESCDACWNRVIPGTGAEIDITDLTRLQYDKEEAK